MQSVRNLFYSRQRGPDFDHSEPVRFHLNLLHPACRLQERERRVQDLCLRREGRQPLQVCPTLQVVVSDDLEEKGLAAEAVGHSYLDVRGGGHGSKLRVCECGKCIQ